MRSRGPVMLILVFFITIGESVGAVSSYSGAVGYTLINSSHSTTNESRYLLYYSFPGNIFTGVKTNFTMMLYLAKLSGYKIFSQEQRLEIILITATNRSVSFTVDQNNRTLFEGGRWGPFNLTLSLDESQVGLSRGSNTNATVFARLVAYEQYNDPLYPFLVSDGASMQLGVVRITNASGDNLTFSDQVFKSLIVGSAVSLVLLGASRLLKRAVPSTKRK